MSLSLKNLQLTSNLFLSPMAGYTNLPFRLVIREIGGVGLCTTDLINARSLLEKNRKAFRLIETCPEDRPLAVQIFGTRAEEMRDAALVLEALGVDAVDVNMGCPARKVCRSGSGSAMMANHEKAVSMVKTMVDAVKIPVTCKMRLGWNEANLTAPDLARALEDVGVAAIAIHGRTRQQGFEGTVNLAGIRAVVKAVKHIPVVANGDITTPQAAKMMFDQTGAAAIGIGRGAFYNPWIFQHTAHYLATGLRRDGAASSAQAGELLPEPTFDERITVMCRHLDLMVQVFGEDLGCTLFRKVARQYSKRFGPVSEFDHRVVKLRSRAEFDEIVAIYRKWRAQFLDENAQLRPQYEPRPLAASLMQEPAKSSRAPAGPNELW